MGTYPAIETIPTGVGDPSSGRDDQYRPHLDGLRAIAIYLVVLFHAGSGWFSGGFVGVDVFFVLSGYLVTQILLRDIGRDGSIRFGRFYARRYRRLLPAAFVALLVTATVYAAIASPADALSSVSGFKAAFLYVSNWFFIHRSTAYFGGDITKNPVLQFWSLAVEEQFYLVWPLALGALVGATRRWGARRLDIIRIVVAGAALTSLVWVLWLRTANPTRAYFGTDGRAYQLLAGALIALVPAAISRVGRLGRRVRILVLMSVAALVVLATSWIHLDPIERGIAVTAVTVLLILAIEAADGGAVKRVLSSAPVVYLGKISYGTYLWHWPVALVIASQFHLSTLSTVAIVGFVATSFASLSFQLLERPVRETPALDSRRRVVIISGLAISIVSALVLVPAILDPGSKAGTALANTDTGFTPVPTGLDYAHATFEALPPLPDCSGKPPSACTVVHGTGRHILLIGDSHAQMLLSAFTTIARQRNLTLSVTASDGCPWQRHVYTPVEQANCQRRKDDAYTRVIPALHPDLIVAINFGYDDTSVTPFPLLGEDRRVVVRDTAAFDTLMARTTTASVNELTAGGRKLLIVEPIPIAPTDPVACLKHAKFLEDCRYIARSRPSVLETLYRNLAAGSPRIWSADFDRLVCPYFPICDPVIARHIVKFDPHHLTLEYANYITPDVEAYLDANHLISG